MITYKITTLFQADWKNLYEALFPNIVHSMSDIEGNVGVFGFDDPKVVPQDLGSLVIIEKIL